MISVVDLLYDDAMRQRQVKRNDGAMIGLGIGKRGQRNSAASFSGFKLSLEQTGLL